MCTHWGARDKHGNLVKHPISERFCHLNRPDCQSRRLLSLTHSRIRSLCWKWRKPSQKHSMQCQSYAFGCILVRWAVRLIPWAAETSGWAFERLPDQSLFIVSQPATLHIDVITRNLWKQGWCLDVSRHDRQQYQFICHVNKPGLLADDVLISQIYRSCSRCGSLL